MPRVATLGTPRPYAFFGTFGGLPFWPGGLTLLAAAPGLGKTSWLLRMIAEASAANIPAALGCYEHTPEELQFRLTLQSQAGAAGPHAAPATGETERRLALSSQAILWELSDQDDTVRAIEEALLLDYAFPKTDGPALLAVDYMQRIPTPGISGAYQAGEAAAQLRALARRRNWAIIAACALDKETFTGPAGLENLLGDPRLSYEADRVLLLERRGQPEPCGCVWIQVHTLKNRTGPASSQTLQFWGERFFPALPEETPARRADHELPLAAGAR